MPRLVRRSVAIGLGLVVLMQSPAWAINVSMTNYDFTPQAVTIRIGETVNWSNDANLAHTSTGDPPLSLWNSGNVPPNGDFARVFGVAGTFPYRCQIHVSLGMVGTVSVRPKAVPASGPVGTTFSLRVATANANSPFVYDIQKKEPGGSFSNWKVGITRRSVNFNSTGEPTGTYAFRSRLRNTSTGASTGYSPARTISVT